MTFLRPRLERYLGYVDAGSRLVFSGQVPFSLLIFSLPLFMVLSTFSAL